MASVGDKLNDDEFFGDVIDTPKEGTEQHKKREELKSIIDKGKLGHKWTHGRLDKASHEVIKKRMLNTSRDVKKIQQDTENYPIIKDQIASLGCLLVCTFGNLLVPVLVAAHTVNNLDLGDEQRHEKEGYESEGPIKSDPCLDLRVLINMSFGSRQMYIEVVQIEPNFLACVPDLFKTQEMSNEAVRIEPY